ncbi:LuxR C-terminal-related transcriptional regulator [Pectobacteriaceae bacterium CE70]|nr:LuxR C-terminal-related transcriptional regulator [Pectobacteriaceae bacterium C52]WJV65706.1 LuxR C-terminal-related transcriptional regulator [Pectobacteriaceae bacterium CE70]WJY09725.1 LuxR C-terminal-related transcriptional regulator [Pectobacteriaceae bacterium C80]
MPRVVIWSECHYTEQGLKLLLLRRMAFIREVASIQFNPKIELNTKDYLIINLTGSNFTRCLDFLKENEEVIDWGRVIILSSEIDAFIIELVLIKKFKFICVSKNVSEIEELCEQFILHKNIETSEYKLNVTNMERKVLIMLMSGLSTIQISYMLKLSFKTVSHHKCNFLKKIGVEKTSALNFWYHHRICNKKKQCKKVIEYA